MQEHEKMSKFKQAREALSQISECVECILVYAERNGVKELSKFKFKEDCEKVEQALAIAERMQWQPIETAPKDGGMFLVCLPRMMNLIVLARFDRVHKQWLTDLESQGLDRVHFFHAGDLWMPMSLPETKGLEDE